MLVKDYKETIIGDGLVSIAYETNGFVHNDEIIVAIQMDGMATEEVIGRFPKQGNGDYQYILEANKLYESAAADPYSYLF